MDNIYHLWTSPVPEMSRSSPSWSNLQINTEGVTSSKYHRFVPEKNRKALEKLFYPTSHLIIEGMVLCSLTICSGVKLQSESFCFIFSIHKRWGSSRSWQNKCKMDAMGAGKERVPCYSVDCPFLPPEIQPRDAQIQIQAGGLIFSKACGYLEKNDPFCLRGQASTMFGLAFSTDFCLCTNQCPHFFQPFHQITFFLPCRNGHIPPSILSTKKANQGLQFSKPSL